MSQTPRRDHTHFFHSIRTVFKPFATGSLLLMGPVSGLYGKSAPVYREDIRAGIHEKVCQNKKAPDSEFLWAQRIHDSGMVLRILQKKDSGPVSDRKLQILAKSMAVRTEHRSYSFGQCHGGLGWVLSSPAPGPLKSEKELMSVIQSSGAQECRKLVAELASLNSASTEVLFDAKNSRGGSLKVPSRAGVISLSCLPKEPAWAGPELWYLFPTEKARSKDLLKNGIWAEKSGPDGIETSIVAWIRQVRKDQGLGDLELFQGSMRDRARFLTLSGSVRHDRRDLQDIRTSLKKDHIDFLGENRVIAKDAKTMSQLFWISPAHRRLILNAEADVGAVSFDPDTSLLVLILGKRSPGPVAQTVKPSASAQKR